MNHDAVIFDLDGTLLDTLEDLADSMNRVLAQRSLPVHQVDNYRYYVGQGMTNLARSAAPPGSTPAVVEDVRQAMVGDYGENWAVKTRPYPGVPELLAALRRRGTKLGVISNKPDCFVPVVVEWFFPQGMFDSMQGARDDVPIKPDPAGALMVAKTLGVSPERCLYVGDTNTDMRTGRAAGMWTVGVTWGFRPDELAESGAQSIVSQPGEIEQLV